MTHPPPPATPGVGEKYSQTILHGPTSLHCKKNPIYVFLFWKLRGLSLNFHIHESVSNLYIPRIGPHISCSRKGKSIVGKYKSLTGTWMWKLGLCPRNSFSGNFCFEFSVWFLAVWPVQCLGIETLPPFIQTGVLYIFLFYLYSGASCWYPGSRKLLLLALSSHSSIFQLNSFILKNKIV